MTTTAARFGFANQLFHSVIVILCIVLIRLSLVFYTFIYITRGWISLFTGQRKLWNEHIDKERGIPMFLALRSI
jgi:hypothetical protein